MDSLEHYPTGEDILDVAWRSLTCNIIAIEDETQACIRDAYLATRKLDEFLDEQAAIGATREWRRVIAANGTEY